jgi:phage shock protein E
MAAAIVVFLAVRTFLNRKAPAKVVLEKIGLGATIIDVRSPSEYAAGSYPKAKNIPVDRLSAQLDKLPKDKPVVTFCASGARSAQAVKILKAAGFTDVVSAGGLSDMPRR